MKTTLLKMVLPLAVLGFGATASAQETVCVPGNPLYDRGDYRCFPRRPVPTRARATVRAHVEGARFLSGGGLSASQREMLEDHFDGLSPSLASELPSLVDGDGGLHTPEVLLSVILLPSGSVGRVRVLTRHGNALDRSIAQTLAAGVSEHAGMSVEGSEVEVFVRMRPRLAYTRYRARHVAPPCCVDDYDTDE